MQQPRLRKKRPLSCRLSLFPDSALSSPKRVTASPRIVSLVAIWFPRSSGRGVLFSRWL